MRNFRTLLVAYSAVIIILLSCSSYKAVTTHLNIIYFISGKSNDFAGQSAYPVILHMVDNKKHMLDALKVIAYDEKYGTDFVRPYYNERFLIVALNKCLEETCIYTKIDMDDPFNPSTFHLHCKYEWPGLYSGHLLKRNETYWQTSWINNWHEEIKYITSVNLINGTVIDKESEDVYKDIILYGSPGSRVKGYDHLRLYVDEKRIIHVPDLDQRDKSKRDKFHKALLPKLPDSESSPKEESWTLIVNNKDQLVVNASEKISEKPRRFRSITYIMDKETGEWHIDPFKNSYWLRSFGGKWLAGQISEGWEVWDAHGRKPSPGIKSRLKYAAEKIDTFDIRTRGDYYPGTIFIYNIKTEQTFTIDTGQGDSEVLLVDGDTVYYRVFDELYRAKIGKDGIGAGEFLARDAVVPDIHWAFTGPSPTKN